jgi:hypothetical protein
MVWMKRRKKKVSFQSQMITKFVARINSIWMKLFSRNYVTKAFIFSCVFFSNIKNLAPLDFHTSLLLVIFSAYFIWFDCHYILLMMFFSSGINKTPLKALPINFVWIFMFCWYHYLQIITISSFVSKTTIFYDNMDRFACTWYRLSPKTTHWILLEFFSTWSLLN